MAKPHPLRGKPPQGTETGLDGSQEPFLPEAPTWAVLLPCIRRSAERAP